MFNEAKLNLAKQKLGITKVSNFACSKCQSSGKDAATQLDVEFKEETLRRFNPNTGEPIDHDVLAVYDKRCGEKLTAAVVFDGEIA